MPTSTATSTVTSTIVQQLQTTYLPQAQAAGHSFLGVYYTWLPFLEVVSVLLTIFFCAAIVYVASYTGWYRARAERFQDIILRKDSSKKRVQSTWDEIEGRFFAGSDNDLKMAVLQADTLLDDTLQEVAISGANLGERLKKISTSRLPNIEEVWQAHKLRNRIAHESNFVLKRDLAERALVVYEKALEHLGALPSEDGTTIVKKEEPKTGGHSH